MCSEARYVSTAQVAQAIGVSVTTVKRWVDDGVLPAHKTAGGHRKLIMADVIRLVRDGNLPQADLGMLMPFQATQAKDPAAMLSDLNAALDAHDLDAARSVIHAGYQSGISVEVLADRVIAPVLHRVGQNWFSGAVSVGLEHRITQSFVSALYELRAFLRANVDVNRPVAIGGAPEHDHYILPTLLAKLTLLDAGWDAINLGPHTPMSAFTAALDQLSPKLVWVSAAHLEDPDKFLADYAPFYKRAEERGIPVAVGGQGLTEPVRTRMSYTMYGDGFTQLAAFARTIHRRPTQPRRGRPPNHDANNPPITD